jgi:hypothetical protein
MKISSSRPKDAETQLDGFIAKFSAEHQRVIRDVRKSLRRRFKGAFELAYDNYNFFVIGYSPSARPSDSIVSLVAGSNGVGLCFIHGAKLPDPQGVLRGGGRQTRFVHLDSAATLKQPEIETLVAEAIARARVPLVEGAEGTLVIRSVSAAQRPRQLKK